MAMEKAAASQGEAGAGPGHGHGIHDAGHVRGRIQAGGKCATGNLMSGLANDPYPKMRNSVLTAAISNWSSANAETVAKNLPPNARFCPRCGHRADEKPEGKRCGQLQRRKTCRMPAFCNQCG